MSVFQTVDAVVRGARSSAEVGAYLPSNYEVTGERLDERGRLLVEIAGVDYAGWTFADYVAPRLASGLMFAELAS